MTRTRRPRAASLGSGAAPRRKRVDARSPAATTKSERTRRHLLDRALELFRKRGLDATTMRDIADAAGLSLGAAYYYFPSKEALIFAYYADTQTEMEARAAAYPVGESLRDRLGRVFHDKLAALALHRVMLAGVLPRLVNPRDQVSTFSAETTDVRTRAIAVFERALAPEPLPPRTRRMLARALWLVHLGVLLYFVGDDSPDQARSHRLVDDLLDVAAPLVALARSPAAAAVIDPLFRAAERAGLTIS